MRDFILLHETVYPMCYPLHVLYFIFFFQNKFCGTGVSAFNNLEALADVLFKCHTPP